MRCQQSVSVESPELVTMSLCLAERLLQIYVDRTKTWAAVVDLGRSQRHQSRRAPLPTNSQQLRGLGQII